MSKSFNITFITPCFCRGADASENGEPEVRAASIRGQLHWWLRALGYDSSIEKEIFGSIDGQDGRASKVVVRVRTTALPHSVHPTLPHKQGGPSAPKRAIDPGATFELQISTRYGGFSSTQQEAFDQCLRAWLLLGTLGLRATRAAGSLKWSEQPSTKEEWKTAVRSLLHNSRLKIALLDQPHSTAESARITVSDTIGGRNDQAGESDLRRINNPLGNMRPRKTSPLRFRILEIENKFYIVAIWDGRSEITGNKDTDLQAVIQLLATGSRSAKPKQIGQLLQQATWIHA